MITKEKIHIYHKFKGDIDSWARMGSKKEQSVMKDGDWYLIDGLLQDIQIVKNGLSSNEFSINLQNRLIENCENEEVIDQIKNMNICS